MPAAPGTTFILPKEQKRCYNYLRNPKTNWEVNP